MLAPEITTRFFELPLREAREAFERIYFEQLLGREQSNMSKVAEKAGLERTHLYRKLKQLNIRFSRRTDDSAASLTASREPRTVTSAPATAVRAARMMPLVVGAVGVVYGDIGTSPLYTLRKAFTGSYGLSLTPDNVLGVLSVIFWALVIVVTLKYITLIMRADNRGEGGILALTALVSRGIEDRARMRWWLVGLGIFGAAMFYGDGMITPAISVLGAVEGLGVIAPGAASVHRADRRRHPRRAVRDPAARARRGSAPSSAR